MNGLSVTTYRVEHRPDEANPPELPWCVLKHGRPFIWFRNEVYAEGFVFAGNRGTSMESAQDFVRSMPDCLVEAAKFLTDQNEERVNDPCEQGDHRLFQISGTQETPDRNRKHKEGDRRRV